MGEGFQKPHRLRRRLQINSSPSDLPEWRLIVQASASSDLVDDAMIKSLEHDLIAAFRSKDVSKIMACCAPGNKLFVFDLTIPRQRVGQDDFAKDWQDLFKMTDGPLCVDPSDLAVTTNGGTLAFSHSIVHVSGKRTDGRAIDHTARVTHVYEKMNGKWLIVHEHVSVPIDMSTGKPDFQSRP
jgi:ketosteroid isomerase-like protein